MPVHSSAPTHHIKENLKISERFTIKQKLGQGTFSKYKNELINLRIMKSPPLFSVGSMVESQIGYIQP